MADDMHDFPRENLVRAVMDDGVHFRATDPAVGDGRLGTLTGQFAVFNQWTEINSMWEGNFLERIAPSAFKKTVAENRDGMRVLYDHGKDPQIGNKPLGPIESLSADAGYEVKLLDTSYNRDLLPLLKEGILGASFRFQVMKEELKQDPGISDQNPKGLPERTITEARVFEFGPVTFPAYSGASAGVRSLTDEFLGVRAAMPAGMSMMPAGVTACSMGGKQGYKGDTACHTHDGSQAAMKAAMGKAKADAAGRSEEVPAEERVDAEDLATLAQMIQSGTDYIADQDEPDDQKNIPVMEGILGELSKLVTVEAEEVEPDETEDEENSSGTVGETAAVEMQGEQREEPEHSPDASRATPKPDKQTTSEHKEKKMEHQFKTVEEIDARLEEIKSTQNEMSTEWGVRAFDADTQTTWDELIEEKDQITLDRAAYLERKAYLELQVKNDANKERGAGAPDVVAKRNAAPENVFDMGEYHTRSTSQEHMSRLMEEGAHRAIEGFRYPNPNINQTKASEAAEQILNQDGPDGEIKQRLLVHGSPVYRSAFWKTIAKQPLSAEEQRKMHEGMLIEARAMTAAGDGGVTVPVQIDPTVLLSSTGAINPFREVSKIVRTTSYQWQGVTSTGITAQYRLEGSSMADNSPTLAAPAINPERADAFVPYTWEAAQDWGTLEGEMAAMFADAKDVLEATKFASGAGHSSNEPLGVLIGAGTVVGSSATTTVGTVDIYALEAQLPVRFQPNAVWLATPALFSRIRSQAALGSNSGGIWADSLQVGQPARLLGYPAYKASSVGTAGNLAVSVASTKWGILGDFSKFAIVDRIGFQVRPIDNLFATSGTAAIAYPNGMSGLVCYWRNSSGVLASNAFRVGTVT